MTTLFLISLVSVALFFACVPVVLFGLMLETCAHRAARPANAERRGASVGNRSRVEPDSGVYPSTGSGRLAA